MICLKYSFVFILRSQIKSPCCLNSLKQWVLKLLYMISITLSVYKYCTAHMWNSYFKPCFMPHLIQGSGHYLVPQNCCCISQFRTVLCGTNIERGSNSIYGQKNNFQGTRFPVYSLDQVNQTCLVQLCLAGARFSTWSCPVIV